MIFHTKKKRDYPPNNIGSLSIENHMHNDEKYNEKAKYCGIYVFLVWYITSALIVQRRRMITNAACYRMIL